MYFNQPARKGGNTYPAHSLRPDQPMVSTPDTNQRLKYVEVTKKARCASPG